MLGLDVGNIISIVVYLITLTALFVAMRERINDLKTGREQNAKAIKELRTDFEKHKDDEDCHISSKLWQMLMSRLDSIDEKVEYRNEKRSTRV